MRYFRVQEDGPRVREVSVRNPLVPRYVLIFIIYRPQCSSKFMFLLTIAKIIISILAGTLLTMESLKA